MDKKFKKSIQVAVLVAMMFIFCTPAISEQKPLPVGDSNIPSQTQTDSLADYFQRTKPIDEGIGQALRQMILAVSVVVALGVAAIYTSQKMLPKLSRVQGKKINVVETVHLGSHKTIHLIKVEDRQILIGATRDTITSLIDLGNDTAVSDAQSDLTGDGK